MHLGRLVSGTAKVCRCCNSLWPHLLATHSGPDGADDRLVDRAVGSIARSQADGTGKNHLPSIKVEGCQH